MAPPVLHSWSFIHDILNYATAVFWFFAYVAIIQKVHKERNAYGLSFQTLFALVVVEVSNVLLIVSLLSYHGKPFHADFFLVDCTSAIISICVFVYLYRNFWSTYEKQRDTFGQKYLRLMKVPSCGPSSHVCFLYVLSLFVSFTMFILRRSPHAPSVSDVARYGHGRLALGMLLSFWECFNDSVLALALLPQLFMFYNKRPRKVTNLLGTFVAMLFCARILAFIYWCENPQRTPLVAFHTLVVFVFCVGARYYDQSVAHLHKDSVLYFSFLLRLRLSFPLFHRSQPTGRGIHLTTEALNILILVDFLYYYIKAKLSGEEDIALPI